MINPRQIQGLYSKTGTFTTSHATSPIDTSRTEGLDFWKDHILVPTTGTYSGQARRITGNTALGVFTVDPAFSGATGLVTYAILPDTPSSGADIDTLLVEVADIENHIHSAQKVYPHLANGIILTGGAAAWEIGDWIEIIPAALAEKNTYSITAAATGPGTVTINLNGIDFAKEISIGTTDAVAAELRAMSFTGWVVTGADSDVIFTSTTVGKKTTGTYTDTDTTGATATVAKTVTGCGVGSTFDIHFISVGAVSATDTYHLELASGAALSEVIIGEGRIVRAAAQSGTSPCQFMTPLLAANTRVSGRIASASGGADTMVVALIYHDDYATI